MDSSLRDHDATTAPSRHVWETGSWNWLQFMLQWFIRFSEFAEFTEFKLHFRKTPMYLSCFLDWIALSTMMPHFHQVTIKVPNIMSSNNLKIVVSPSTKHAFKIIQTCPTISWMALHEDAEINQWKFHNDWLPSKFPQCTRKTCSVTFRIHYEFSGSFIHKRVTIYFLNKNLTWFEVVSVFWLFLIQLLLLLLRLSRELNLFPSPLYNKV